MSTMNMSRATMPRATMPRAAKLLAKERIKSILKQEEDESDNESCYMPVIQNNIPHKFIGITMKFIYLIKKMEMCSFRDDKKVTFIDIMELCIENPEFIIECNLFKDILYKKMADFEDIITKENDKINKVNVENKITELIKLVSDSIPNVLESSKIISLLTNAHFIHSRYTGSNSLNNRILLAINSMRDTINKYC